MQVKHLLAILNQTNPHLAADVRGVLHTLGMDAEQEDFRSDGLLKDPVALLGSAPLTPMPEPLAEPQPLFDNAIEHLEDPPAAPTRGKKSPLLEKPEAAL